MTQTICLSMIVKNESAVIARCLASVKPFISSYAIVDTGSTDGTQDIVRETLKDIPGQVIDRPWVNFATGRNQALDLARESGAEFTLTLDADEELVWPAGKPMPELTDDMYGIRFRFDGGEHTWTRTLILRSALPWRWEDPVHERLECVGVEPVRALITGEAHVHSHSDGARGAKPARKYSVRDYLPGRPTAPLPKYKADIAALEAEVAKDSTNARAWFYLAQSYACDQQFEKSIEAYLHRATMGGWVEEVFYSLYQVAALRGLTGAPWEVVAQSHLAAYSARPERAEPLWALAMLHNGRGEPAVGLLYARAACGIPRPVDCLMVNEAVYQFRAAEEVAASLTLLGNYAEALRVLERIAEVKQCAGEDRQRITDNIAYLTEKLGETAQAVAA